jgi:hypothetical protein
MAAEISYLLNGQPWSGLDFDEDLDKGVYGYRVFVLRVRMPCLVDCKEHTTFG